MDAADPYKYFRLEARELLDQLSASLLALEKGGAGADELQKLLRLAHTLKGAARVVRQTDIADLSHAIEDVMSPFRDQAGPPPRREVEAALAHLDAITAHVRNLDGPPNAEPAPAATAAPDEAIRSVRMDIAELDDLLSGIAETHALLTALSPTARAIEEIRHLSDLLVEQLEAPGWREEQRSAAHRARALANDLRGCLGSLDRSMGQTLEQMDRELGQVRQAAEQLRLAPADALFLSLERTARDTAHALGKQVTFEGRGGDIRLDAHVLVAIQRALVQIVRNAVAHGIEGVSERLSRGKPATGRILVQVSRRGREIEFACSDDGRGVDLGAVRAATVQRGLAAPDAARMGVDELVALLLRGGITTSATVTASAGRGVGLDLVRETVARLGGRVACETDDGKGARFILTAPLALASLEVLQADVGGMVVNIPADAVRRCIRLADAEIAESGGGAAVLYEQAAIPFAPLAAVLDEAPSVTKRTWTAIVLQSPAGVAALGIDRLLGTAQVVVRPLPDLAPASPVVAGLALDVEGNAQLVLDPEGLVMAAGSGARVGARQSARAPVLVIDDSLTTRMLEQSILESAGYEVDLAVSAEEGLEKARRRAYGLYLVDVEMPGMNGFAFIEHIRRDPELGGTPAVLVTSLDSPEDRQRGVDVGAQGYVVKSAFDQSDLLTLIREQMG